MTHETLAEELEGDCILPLMHDGPCRPAPAKPAEPCRRGVCSANNGHDGTCAEASGWAEPAEEETKAEDVTAERLAELIADAPAANYEENDYNAGYVAALISLRDELGEVTRPTAEGSRAVTFDEIAQSLKSIGDAESSFGFNLRFWRRITEKLIAKYPHVLSSPVIPAPTETGPWQTWQEVPDDVWFTSTSAVGSLPAHRKRGNLVDWQFRDGSVGVYDDSRIGNGKLMARAPFVAAEEG